MNPWIINPSWQNFSSMYREAVTAMDIKDEATKYHHLTASLYFGISFLEAYFNERMRTKLYKEGKKEDNIYYILRSTSIKDKLRKWPKLTTGKVLIISTQAEEIISLAIKIRGNLIHPKTRGHDIYEQLEKIDSDQYIFAVAEYCVKYCEVLDEFFPYWIFGWNYLNPSQAEFSLILENNQQFLFSLEALGFDNPAADAAKAEDWKRQNMISYEGYLNIHRRLKQLGHCEPRRLTKYQPVLCRKWWHHEHIVTCGGLDHGKQYLLERR